MIVKTPDLLVCDIVGIERTNIVNGEKRYGLNLYIRGGGYIPLRAGNETKLNTLIEKLGYIILEEKATRVRNNDPLFEYIVNIQNAEVKSKQLLTEDKAIKMSYS